MHGSKGNSLTSFSLFFVLIFPFSPTWKEGPPRPRVHRHVRRSRRRGWFFPYTARYRRCHGYLHASNKRWLRGSRLAQGKKRKRVAKFYPPSPTSPYAASPRLLPCLLRPRLVFPSRSWLTPSRLHNSVEVYTSHPHGEATEESLWMGAVRRRERMTVEPREHSYRREKKMSKLALTRERKPSRVYPQLFPQHVPSS